MELQGGINYSDLNNRSEEEPVETLYPGLGPTSRRMMGFKEFDRLSEEQEKELLKTEDRYLAYKNTDTTTAPRGHKIEYKKGIIREFLQKEIVSDEILKKFPSVYLGSGSDIEYPLSLGSREIILIDPMFQEAEMKEELLRRIEEIIKEKISDSKNISFHFDFGQGNEIVNVKIISDYYDDTTTKFPDKVGLVIMFASQGSGGRVEIGENLEKAIVEGGAILHESKVIKFENNEKKNIQLGR